MVTIERYDDLFRQVMQHDQARDYVVALDLLSQEAERFPAQAATSLYLRSCTAARLGQTELALHGLDQALQAGLRFSEPIMRRTPFWQDLQGLPEFERIVSA